MLWTHVRNSASPLRTGMMMLTRGGGDGRRYRMRKPPSSTSTAASVFVRFRWSRSASAPMARAASRRGASFSAAGVSLRWQSIRGMWRIAAAPTCSSKRRIKSNSPTGSYAARRPPSAFTCGLRKAQSGMRRWPERKSASSHSGLKDGECRFPVRRSGRRRVDQDRARSFIATWRCNYSARIAPGSSRISLRRLGWRS